MTNCEIWREDPDAHPEHPEGCAACAGVLASLERLDEGLAALGTSPRQNFQGEVQRRLPLAPWEGARHRSWGLVLAVVATLALLVTAAFMAGGVNPIRAIGPLLRSMLAIGDPSEIVRSFSALVATAPTSFHVTVGVLFVLVNAILVLLLRRRPGGYDA